MNGETWIGITCKGLAILQKENAHLELIDKILLVLVELLSSCFVFVLKSVSSPSIFSACGLKFQITVQGYHDVGLKVLKSFHGFLLLLSFSKTIICPFKKHRP